MPLGICEFWIKQINLGKNEVLAGVLVLKHFLGGVVKDLGENLLLLRMTQKDDSENQHSQR